jgi:hypothetical protein
MPLVDGEAASIGVSDPDALQCPFGKATSNRREASQPLFRRQLRGSCRNAIARQIVVVRHLLKI